MEKRFGVTAVDKGYIKAEHLVEAMAVQIMEELERRRHLPIGQILVDLGYLEYNQMGDVLRAMGLNLGFWETRTREAGGAPAPGPAGDPSLRGIFPQSGSGAGEPC